MDNLTSGYDFNFAYIKLSRFKSSTFISLNPNRFPFKVTIFGDYYSSILLHVTDKLSDTSCDANVIECSGQSGVTCSSLQENETAQTIMCSNGGEGNFCGFFSSSLSTFT